MGTVMKVFEWLLFAVILCVFFAFPLTTGYAKLPANLTPKEIGSFIGGVAVYWLEVAEAILKALGVIIFERT